MGDASFNKGGVATRNLKAGSVTLTGYSSSVSLDRPMKSVPSVVVTAETDANVYVSAKSQTGFTLRTPATQNATVNYIAFNDDRA